MSLTKYASLESAEVLELKSSPTRVKTASLDKLSDFHEYRTEDGYLYARIRAISSRVNKNHDGWPTIELAGGQEAWEKESSRHEASSGFSVQASKGAKYGFSTFLGKPHFVDHNNSDPKRARGVVVDASFHVLDQKTAAAEDEYWGSSDVDPEHFPPAEVELLIEVDAKSFPKLAKAIVDGDIDGFSMGCDVDYSKCSHCGTKASSPDEYCTHVQAKGGEFDYTSSDGKTSSRKSYENCYGIKFFEISAVFDPADETALAKEIRSEGRESKTGSYLQTRIRAEKLAGPYRDTSEVPVEEIEQLAKKIVNENPGLSLEEAFPLAQQEIGQRFDIHPDDVKGGDGYSKPEPKRWEYDTKMPGKFPFPNHDRIGPVGEPLRSPDLNPEFMDKADELLHERHPTYKNLVRNDPTTSKTATVKTAQPDEPQIDHIRAPEEVNTTREEQVCPLCGSDMEDSKCVVCGYEEPPESMQNPDLNKAKEQVEALESEGQAPAGPTSDPLNPKSADPQESYLNARNTKPASTLTSEMRWAPRIELDKVSASGPKGDEPDETVTSDEIEPVTAAFRTAKELIQAAKRNHKETDMSDDVTKVAADPADSSGSAKKQIDVNGVGGVDQATNEEASKANGGTSNEKHLQVDVEAKGGIDGDNKSVDTADHVELPSGEQDNAGFQSGGETGDDTKTFDNSNEPDSAVTDKVFPTAANHGTQPADPVGKAGDRIDVEQPPHDQLGPDTQTWSGTSGNGVTKQQDAVTSDKPYWVDESKWTKSHVSLAALKLADAEVELGITNKDDKYNRLAELAETPEDEIVAEHRALAKVKTAGLTRTASQGGASRLPSFQRIASEETPEAQPINDALLDSSLFTR